MDADLDTLATALYVTCDDLLTQFPDHAPERPRVGLAPRISDAELVTLAVMSALLGYASERRWLRHVKTHLAQAFPYVPKQSGYNKRLRKLAGTMAWLVTELGSVSASLTTTSGSWIPRRSNVAGPEKPRCDQIWLGGPSTVTALPIRGSSGGCGCTWCAPCTGWSSDGR